MLFTWERSFDPEMALPRSSSGKSNYLGYIYTHTGQLLRRELKPYRIGFLFTRNYGDLGVISVAEQSWTAPISKVERHVSDLDRYLYGNEKEERGLEPTGTEVIFGSEDWDFFF